MASAGVERLYIVELSCCVKVQSIRHLPNPNQMRDQSSDMMSDRRGRTCSVEMDSVTGAIICKLKTDTAGPFSISSVLYRIIIAQEESEKAQGR